MPESLFSPSWYRVAQLKPRLRSHADIHRHSYRDEIWYVLQDNLAGRYHRFSEAAYQVIGLMDGVRTVQEVWEQSAEQLGEDSPTQEEIIRLLAQLHSADVLQSEVPPDSAELFRRYQRQQRARWKQKLRSPLAIRFGLFDPERVLVKMLPLVRPLFSWVGFLLWLAVVVTGVVLAMTHWSELSEDMVDRVLAPQNLLILWLVYPLVKILHEFGHAFATKVWGGEVHEIGIMFLVLMPVPYVDASAASAFREKRKRMVVGAIGIMMELLLAALALLVWLNAEYGLVRAVAYNIMLIGGVSTLFFNGNPLLRFDGYYVLADGIEIPNLAKRSQQYLGYLAQRYLFGSKDASSPATTGSERKWFVFYGVASFVYRMFIAMVIILFIAGKFFIVGILLALWAAFTMLVLPLFKSLKHIVSSPKLVKNRPRALGISAVIAALAGIGLFLAPAPYLTLAEGVVWLPEQSIVRAGTACFVEDYSVQPDSKVEKDRTLLSCADPLLRARKEALAARLKELKALYAAQWKADRVAARLTTAELRAVEGDLADVRQRMDQLSISSPAEGRFVVPKYQDLIGRFLQQGEIVGYVLNPSAMTVRVAIPESDIGLVRARAGEVEVRLVNGINQSYPASIVRQIPGGRKMLPSAVLGKSGGGRIEVDPRDQRGLTTFASVFEYQLTLPPQVQHSPVGTRVFVRFDHGSEPLAYQWFRSVRQVFLGKFGV